MILVAGSNLELWKCDIFCSPPVCHNGQDDLCVAVIGINTCVPCIRETTHHESEPDKRRVQETERSQEPWESGEGMEEVMYV